MNPKLRLFKRTLPPAAAPLSFRDVFHGLCGICNGQREIERFRSEIRAYFDVKHCFVVSSGRAALTLVLRALHDLYPDRNEVIVPAYTCFSVPASIVRAGLKIRLCDIDAETLDFDLEQLNSLLSNKRNNSSRNRFLCIISTHLFGLPSDIDRVKTIIGDREIPIVEDAAQALGGVYRKSKLGTMGDVGFFSLGRGKAMTTVEGGIIITARDDIATGIENQIKGMKRCTYFETISLIVKALFLVLFVHPGLYWFPRSLPFLRLGETLYDEGFDIIHLSPFQAGMAKRWQRRIEHLKQARRKRALRFLPIVHGNRFYSYVSDGSELPDILRFPLLCRDVSFREDQGCLEAMDRLGIVPSYPTSIQDIEELRDRFTGEQYPGADRLAEHLMTIPIHPLVSEADVDEIIELLKDSK